MRNKDLKKIIKAKANDVEIKDFTNEILNKVDHKAVVEENIKHRSHTLFYSLGGLCSALAIILLVLFLVKPAVGPDPLPSLTKKEMVLSKEAIALGNAIESIQGESNFSLMGYTLVDDSDDIPALSKEEYKRIALEMNTYLYAADSFINNSLDVSLNDNNDENYNYQYKMTIAINDNNFKKEYTLYYSENGSGSEVDIVGVMIIDNQEHMLEGEREDDGDECELELKLITSDNSYISIKNETEINENEFEYTFFENGMIVKSVAMELEIENGRKEASIEIIDGFATKGFEFEYHDSFIEAEYISNELEFEMVIEIYDTYYLYKFEDLDYNLKLDK